MRPGSISFAISSTCPLCMSRCSPIRSVLYAASPFGISISDRLKNEECVDEGEHLLPRAVSEALNLHIDELRRRGGLLQHVPTLEPVVSALHLVGWDRRWVANLKAALAQILDFQRRDLRIALTVIVDEVVEIGAFVR